MYVNFFDDSYNFDNALVTIASTTELLSKWERLSKSSWVDYCQRHNLGLIVFTQELDTSENRKKPHWQKLLIGTLLAKHIPTLRNICILDTDVVISPLAPNLFDQYNSKKIGLTSLRTNLPFPYHAALRRIAFLRNRHYDSTYPTDSALFMSLEQLYSWHKLPTQPDEACTGFIVCNIQRHSDQMSSWYRKYPKGIETITNGGEQTHLNFEIQSNGEVQWFEYGFQAIWPFEMAWKYPFLYEKQYKSDVALIRHCIHASLIQNHFLHFAGSWHESEMWEAGPFFDEANSREDITLYADYLSKPVSGQPKGMIRPQK